MARSIIASRSSGAGVMRVRRVARIAITMSTDIIAPTAGDQVLQPDLGAADLRGDTGVAENIIATLGCPLAICSMGAVLKLRMSPAHRRMCSTAARDVGLVHLHRVEAGAEHGCGDHVAGLVHQRAMPQPLQARGPAQGRRAVPGVVGRNAVGATFMTFVDDLIATLDGGPHVGTR